MKLNSDLLADESKEPEPIKVERAITNRIKKLKNSPPKNSPNPIDGAIDSKFAENILVENSNDKETADSLANNQLEPVVDDKQAIDSALIEAFQRLDENLEVNQGLYRTRAYWTGRPDSGQSIDRVFRPYFQKLDQSKLI